MLLWGRKDLLKGMRRHWLSNYNWKNLPVSLPLDSVSHVGAGIAVPTAESLGSTNQGGSTIAYSIILHKLRCQVTLASPFVKIIILQLPLQAFSAGCKSSWKRAFVSLLQQVHRNTLSRASILNKINGRMFVALGTHSAVIWKMMLVTADDFPFC